MICKKCAYKYSIKDTDDYISILCHCEIKIIYNNGKIKIVQKEEYLKNKNKDVSAWL